MRIIIHDNYQALSKWTAYYIAKRISDFNPTPEKPFVLGLPSGTSPLGTFQQIVNLHEEGKISFQNVITFNMDEYVKCPEDNPGSYHYMMYSNLFNHIDIPRENINMLNGNASDLEKECSEYEEKIISSGGINLFFCGIGPDGHIAFNEPGSSLSSRTRIKTLTYENILANSQFFKNDISKVPKLALTVGIGTVMDAEEVLVVAGGHSKTRALQKAVEEGVNHMWNISALQLHKKGIIVCDEEATYELKVGTVKYFKEIEKEAIENLPEL
ncbi:MAG: glucosamine-6-phosphate deaminase [Ignavibacteriales bacterium]|nr:glucosamine-6-phosphate deaminase [Ignavibacteriales bacterium]